MLAKKMSNIFFIAGEKMEHTRSLEEYRNNFWVALFNGVLLISCGYYYLSAHTQFLITLY
jgi:hypothetical protein